MHTYVQNELMKFQHPFTKTAQHQPHKYIPIKYRMQTETTLIKNSLPLNKKQIRHVQEIIFTLLYYARVVDPSLACALSSNAARQAHGTKEVTDAYNQLLDYVATHSNATI